MISYRKKLFVLVSLASFYAVSSASALTVPTPSNMTQLPVPPIQNTQDVQYLAQGVLVWIFWGLIIFSVVMFLVGGYRYVTSGGDPEKVSGANKTLIYAAIAVVVALLAAGIPNIIASFFGVPSL